MITTKEVKVKVPQEVTSEYIETELAKMGLDVLRWVITECSGNYYTINVSVVDNREGS